METLQQEKKRILIVDDTPANIDVMGAILMSDYDISVALNGAMALDIVESGTPPDLILLDIMMPEMDGYEVTRRLKANEKTRQIPVIFVTAKIEEEDEAFGFQIGAVDYIRKPVNPCVTLARIKCQIELKRYKDQLAVLVEKKTTQVETSLKQLEDKRHKLSKAAEDLKDFEASAHKNHIYFRELFMNSPHGIILVGPDNKIISTNKSFSKLVGYDIEEIVNKKISGFSVAGDCKDEHSSLVQEALKGKTVSVETRCFHKKGFKIHVSALAYPVKINNSIQGVFVFYENISQRKLFEGKLKHQAYHDVLTGIPNRLLFSERLDFAIEKQKSSSIYRFAVLLIDLDRFKSINDSLGHQAGDELLKAVSAKVQGCLRADDTLARLGGDEFAILLSDIKGQAEVNAIASRICQAAESTFIIDKQEVHISASIGVVIDTKSYGNANLLLRDADLAMYNAKDAGKAQFKIFSRKMHEELMASITIEKELRKAIEQDRLVLYFQPIVQVPTGRLEGFEALIRWNHPEQGIVSPDNFIPIAEETGLMVPMGEWIIQTACQQLASWQQTFSKNLTVSINISIKQFSQNNFVEHLYETTKKHRLSPSDIKLEFTESLLMEHTCSAVQKLDKLRDLGFFLVIDDFGTGYSSLSYLQQFPINQI
ncbi:MAG: EAL domain-containing protein, partial [Desulfobacula sp.]|nr:EAL domain-containing protein [Desulfobacula sp.]